MEGEEQDVLARVLLYQEMNPGEKQKQIYTRCDMKSERDGEGF
jgi:hypothetical protein